MRRPAVWLAVAAALLLAAGGWFLLRRGEAPGPAQGPGLPGVAGMADLYFADSDGSRLAIERRAVPQGTPAETARAVAEELILGPRDASLLPTVPPTSAVRAVYLRGDTAYLDFTAPLASAHPGGSWSEALTVYSIVNSIAANVPGVARVQILVEGREGESLAGHIVLDRPLSPQARLLDGNL